MASEQYVIFEVSDREWAIPIDGMRSIEKPMKVTAIPKTPPYYKGIVNWRDKIIPIIDLKDFFELPQSQETDERRIIVTETMGKTVGLFVDKISDIKLIDTKLIEGTPDAMSQDLPREYIKGIAKVEEKLILLLDIDKIINSP